MPLGRSSIGSKPSFSAYQARARAMSEAGRVVWTRRSVSTANPPEGRVTERYACRWTDDNGRRPQTGRGSSAGCLGRLEDQVHVQRRASQQPAALPQLDLVPAELAQLEAVEVRDDVRDGGALRDLHVELGWRLKEPPAIGSEHLQREVVWTGLGVHHRHDEQARMDRGEPRDVDLPEDADRADLPVLARERVVAQQDCAERELRRTHA